MSANPALDLEIVECEGKEWQVWTPSYPAGACIGSGTNQVEAIQATIANLEATIEQERRQLAALKPLNSSTSP